MFPRHGNKTDNRLFLDAVYWVDKTGIPWRDLPERFGKWNSVYVRFIRLSKSGFWQKVFDGSKDEDLKQLLIDSSSICVNQQGANGLKKQSGSNPQPITRRVDHKGSFSRRPKHESTAHHYRTRQ
ncbi:MAG: transposase [Bacteroidota bacterium]